MCRSVSIILYGYNEGENAPSMVEEAFDYLDKSSLEGEVVFVNDGSSDETEERMRDFSGESRFRYLSHGTNRGIGAAIRTGIAGSEKDWIAALPADGQISPHELKKMVDASSGVALVVSRFPERFKTADDMIRKVFSTGFHLMCRLFMGGGWGMDGVWMARREDLVAAAFASETFVANIEIPVRLIRSGVKWKRVDIQVRRRAGGSSKIFSPGRIMRVAGEIVKIGYMIKGSRKNKFPL